MIESAFRGSVIDAASEDPTSTSSRLVVRFDSNCQKGRIVLAKIINIGRSSCVGYDPDGTRLMFFAHFDGQTTKITGIAISPLFSPFDHLLSIFFFVLRRIEESVRIETVILKGLVKVTVYWQ